jgi:two-component system, NtrC family, sensor kinase
MNTIFIADDNNTDRTILEATLQKLGFSTNAFNSGSSVYEAIMNFPHPLVALLDWIMPDKSGVEICRALSMVSPARPVYAIVVTSRTDKTDIAFALENGADDYVTKPFNVHELRARINVGIRLLTFRQQLSDSNAQLLEYTKHVEAIAEARAEQLVRADRLSTIGMLSAGIAHEINNPCSFIAVNIQTLREHWEYISGALAESVSDEKKSTAHRFAAMVPDILAEMKNGVDRIHKIVNGLKTYAHPVSGENTRFKIETCIESALNLCANKLKYHVTIKKEYGETAEVSGDQYRIVQVFVNLFANAADAIEESRKDGVLTISTEHRNDLVIAYVRDNGPGISVENREKMFIPFFTTKPIGRGTGLGLSISKNIMQDHRGDLMMETPPEGGILFKVLLPSQRKES